ncbi:hypothetical protein E3J62_06760 [candidate division TA06 bacterium]|uniref:PLD phosphodiesterase domain-containing protein n=1 Tax=candidate division TA06 bacterium TaxID=2250710 RepID=A0A523UTE2_UNCT6|nr:MAG: hypothetical protein E3J62_06760 [candidate division TA06 bacterium]
MSSTIIKNMIKGLDAELAAVHKQGGSSQVELRGGKSKGKVGDGFLYAFTLTDQVYLRDDAPIEITVEGERVGGRMVSERDGIVTLISEKGLGSRLPSVHLKADNSILPQQLRDRLSEIITGDSYFNSVLADKVIGHDRPRVSEFSYSPSPDALRMPSDEQKRAIELALGTDVCYLCGAQGTGKTTTVARVIHQLYRKGHSVLLVSDTNFAVDTALEKVFKLLRNEQDFGLGAVVRYGPIVKKELAKFASNVLLDNIVERLCIKRQKSKRKARYLKQLRPETAVLVLAKDLENVREEVMHLCRVMATTAHMACDKDQLDRMFDVVVIDDASTLPLPLVYFLSGLARHKVLIAGDFQQLPPIVRANNPACEEWFKKDVFRKSGVVASLKAGEYHEGLAVLHSQYKMREPISRLVSDLFYEHTPIVTDSRVRGRRRSNFPTELGAKELLYVDTSSVAPWASQRQGTRSTYNFLHALVVRNIICRLGKKGLMAKKTGRNTKIGTVTPYWAQAALISALASEKLDYHGTDIAATVYRSQHNEKDCVVVDLCDSIGVKPSRIMSAHELDADGARLLNVALSRARDVLMLVANFDYAKTEIRENSFVRRIIAAFEKDGEPLKVEDILPLGPEDWLDGLSTETGRELKMSPEASGLFNESTFYQAFKQDLMDARKGIVIFSPFFSERGIFRWTDTLRVKRETDVKVEIVTLPPYQQPAAGEETGKVLKGLEESGFTVALRSNMHEKFAMVDGRILWLGPLNILSHKDTDQVMLRLSSKAACRMMTEMQSLPERMKEVPSFANPKCGKCGGLTVWKSSAYGVHFQCFDCGHREEPK